MSKPRNTNDYADDPWHYIARGDYEGALARYAQFSSLRPPDLNNIGIMYLRMNCPSKAKESFRKSLDIRDYTERTWICLGVCCWLEADTASALDAWRSSLKATYCGSACLNGPMVLYFAGVRLQDTALQQDMLELMRKRIRRARFTDIELKIAEIIMGQSSEEDATSWIQSQESRPGSRLSDRVMLEFYMFVLDLQARNHARAKERLRNAASKTECFSLPEKYLAVYELSKLYEEAS